MSKKALSPEVMQALANACKAATAYVRVESTTASDIKKLADAGKKARDAHLVEWNLNLKTAYAKGWRWTGTMKTNDGIKMIHTALVDGGQVESTASNTLWAMKHCFTKKWDLPEFNGGRVKRRTEFTSWDGKKVKVLAHVENCAKSLLTALQQEQFAAVMLGALDALKLDYKGIKSPAEAVVLAVQVSMLNKGLVEKSKDGKKLKAK